MQNFVAYFRVSTARQGRSGLGLEAQRKMVTDYVASVGGTIIAELTEIESGKRATNRPELQKALAIARKRNKPAVLIVAKLDRLARSVSFISALLDSNVEFRAADFPEANRMMLQILAVIAEYEARQISDRTKQALAARRARGFQLGNVNNLKIGNVSTPAVNRAKAVEQAERLRPVIDDIKRQGADTLQSIADQLNRRGFTNSGGGTFYPTTVQRVMERLNPVQAMPSASYAR